MHRYCTDGAQIVRRRYLPHYRKKPKGGLTKTWLLVNEQCEGIGYIIPIAEGVAAAGAQN
ncbi:MAG TPA: hypothetical protein VGK38_09525 [Prolixibacteraceae bacterium]